MLHVVLFQPDIPQNTGNVGRMCAITGARLHMIKPYGFEITDRHLRRSGMDYWQQLDLCEHDDWQSFLDSGDGPWRIWAMSTHATQVLWDVSFADGDGLLFGKETSGLPAWLHEWAGDERRVKIPQPTERLRSLNLATAAGIATYEALRQLTRPAG